eukprot:gene2374-3682_t
MTVVREAIRLARLPSGVGRKQDNAAKGRDELDAEQKEDVWTGCFDEEDVRVDTGADVIRLLTATGKSKRAESEYAAALDEHYAFKGQHMVPTPQQRLLTIQHRMYVADASGRSAAWVSNAEYNPAARDSSKDLAEDHRRHKILEKQYLAKRYLIHGAVGEGKVWREIEEDAGFLRDEWEAERQAEPFSMAKTVAGVLDAINSRRGTRIGRLPPPKSGHHPCFHPNSAYKFKARPAADAVLVSPGDMEPGQNPYLAAAHDFSIPVLNLGE